MTPRIDGKIGTLVTVYDETKSGSRSQVSDRAAVLFRRWKRAELRLWRLEAVFLDRPKIEAIVRDGRDLKLCMLIEIASAAADRARADLLAEQEAYAFALLIQDNCA